MKIKYICRLLLSGLILFQSCISRDKRIAEGDAIPVNIRTTVAPMCDKLYHAIADDTLALVQPLLSDTFIKNGENLLRDKKEAMCDLKSGNYRLLRQLYIMAKINSSATTISDSVYSFSFNLHNEETYAVILLAGTNNQVVIPAIFSRYGDTWKLDAASVRPYTIGGKTARDFLDLSKACYGRGRLADAYNNVRMAMKFCEQKGSYIKYKDEDQIKLTYKNLRKEIYTRYKFPYELSAIPTHPRFLGIYPVMIFDGTYYPGVYYTSTVNIADTVALKHENELVQKEINQMFYGINKNKNYIYYGVVNAIWSVKDTAHALLYTFKIPLVVPSVSKTNSEP